MTIVEVRGEFVASDAIDTSGVNPVPRWHDEGVARPDVRFNTPPRPPRPKPDVTFTENGTSESSTSKSSTSKSSTSESRAGVIDLREGPGITDTEARAILGVDADADWSEVKASYLTLLAQLAGERHRLNTAYATLRLLSIG